MNFPTSTTPKRRPKPKSHYLRSQKQLLPHKRGLRNLNATPKRIRFDVKILGLSEDLQEGEEGLRGRVKGKKRRRPRSYKGVPEGYKLSMGVLVKDLEQRFPLRNGKGPSGFSQGDFYKDLEEKITDEIYRIENEDGYKNKFESRMRYLNKKKYKREVKAKKVRSKLLRHNKEMAKNWSQIKKEVQSPAHSGTPMNKRFYSSTQSFKIKRSLSKKPSRRYGKPPIPKKSVTKSFKDYTLFL
ncbi:unnamed protein product [Moneuplotes crassus]|uniref:Uncharacterized protein n=2 Tax=Euplotes crassus TaxID=5936 RepID=A0AAD2CXX1_EUPCR|nr:unnamed protein product [Moneuplotes crassus]